MNSQPKHHPDESILMDLSSGSLSEGVSALIEAHLSSCQKCSEIKYYFDSLGGELLNEITPVKMKNNLVEKITSEDEARKNLSDFEKSPDTLIPTSLNKWIKDGLSNLQWIKRGKGLEEFAVKINNTIDTLLLYRIQAGKALPKHSHEGEEVTLVLSGGFSDEHGHYLPYDIVFADKNITHTPVADDDGECIVAVVKNGSIRLSGALGKVIEMVVGKL